MKKVLVQIKAVAKFRAHQTAQKKSAKKIFSQTLVILLACFFSAPLLQAQSHMSTQAHHDSVSALVPVLQAKNKKNNSFSNFSFFSAGKDGFLVNWEADGQGDHYQVTNYEIRLAALSPKSGDVAIYETDGAAFHQVSVWDWQKLAKKFAHRFSDSVTSLAYSANGSYLFVGTATVEGVVTLNASTGSEANLIKDSTGIVSYVATSDTEKTAVMYSPAGNISYYNLKTGKMSARFRTETGLEQTVMFNNNLYLAGVKEGTIFVVNSVSGKIVASRKCSSPVLITSPSDEDLFFIEAGNRKYTAFTMKNSNNQDLQAAQPVCDFSLPVATEVISHGLKYGDLLMLASASGNIFKISGTANLNAKTENYTDNTYEKILDVDKAGADFYFLTKNDIFISSYKSNQLQKIASNTNHHDKIISAEGGLVLWTENSKAAVEFIDLASGKTTQLFTPKANIRHLKIFGKKLVLIENYSNIFVYDFDTGKLTNTYTGTALQDAAIMDDGNIYVAKSSSTFPNTPLVAVNVATGETVPIKLDANVSFALGGGGQKLYGIAHKAQGTEQSTFLFLYNTQAKKADAIMKMAGEDLGAFTFIGEKNIYTNIGTDRLYCYNPQSRKNVHFDRSASIPLKVCENDNMTVVLNYDGSISWHNTATAQILADWYLTKDGTWFEF